MPPVPIRIEVDKSHIRLVLIRFAIVLAIFIVSILIPHKTIKEDPPIYLVLFIILMFLIVSTINLLKIFSLIINPVWLEITENGVKYRTGFFNKTKYLQWNQVLKFRFWYSKKILPSFKMKEKPGKPNVYFTLKHKYATQKNITAYDKQKFDGCINIPTDLHKEGGQNYISYPDPSLVHLISPNWKHPPLARFLNDLKKLSSNGKNRTLDCNKT